MASIDASAYSKDLGAPAVASSQQPLSDLIANSGHHILRRADQSMSKPYINQGHDNEINMFAHLPRDVPSFQPQEDINSSKTSKHQSPDALMTFSAPQDQYSHQSVEDSVRFSRPQDQYSHQSVEDSVRFSKPQDQFSHQSVEDSVRFSGPQDQYSHQSVEDSVRISGPQTPARSGTTGQTAGDNPHLYRMLLDIHHSAQPWTGSRRAEDHKPDVPQISSNMYSFEPQISSYRNPQIYNRQFSHMTNDVLWSQHDMDHQESHNEQMAQSLMEKPLLRSQLGFPEIKEAHDRQLAHHRQLNHALKSMTHNRTEPPRTMEALNRQMALFATRDVHNDWQNGLQAGSRPAFWDQCRQNFGISQHFQSEPSARNMPSDSRATLFPQLHLRPDYFRSQQFDALQGWPSSVDENARIEPFLNPQVHQVQLHQVQPHQPSVLPAPLSISQMGPAAMHTLSPALDPSDFSSKPQLPKTTSDDLYATKQPPIGTPRASGPKLTTTTFERTTGHDQTTDNEPILLPSLPYYPGSDIMYPYVKENPSEGLRRLTAHGRLSIDKLLDRDIVPFIKGNENSRAVDWGVIRIGNIPYSLTRPEVVSFLGSDAKVIPPALGTGVHIIMERTTGKTMDCYVEFQSVYEAQIAVNHLVYRGHPLRLGNPPHDRVVNVTMSSQDELMKQLFPRAKNVVWINGKPVIQASNEPFNTGFKTFITGEELVMMCKHAEQPHRSSYIQRCPQRTYECMISTLAKFPWYAVDHYTLGTREQIFNTTRDMLRHLVYFLKRGGLSNINHNLLFEYMITGLNAVGFSERQRWELVQAAEHTGQSIRISPLSQWWPWEALGRRAGIEEDVVRHYAHLITLHPTLKATATEGEAGTSNPFGGSVEHDSVDITLAEAATKEWELFEAILRDVLRQIQSA